MTIKEVNYYEEVALRTSMRKPGKIQKVLDEFVTSGYACAEVINLHHKSIDSARITFFKAIQRYGMPHIRVHARKGKLYLINMMLIGNKFV